MFITAKIRFFLETTKRITRNLQVINELPQNQHHIIIMAIFISKMVQR